VKPAILRLSGRTFRLFQELVEEPKKVFGRLCATPLLVVAGEQLVRLQAASLLGVRRLGRSVR
jgi:hypothetical protein